MKDEIENCKDEDSDKTEKKGKGKVKNSITINPPLKEGRMSFSQFLASEDDLEEGLSVAQRMKKGNNMKRNEPKLQAARKRVLARHAEKKRLEKRSRRDAVDKVKSKYTGGQNVDDLSYGDKSRIEDILKTKKGAVTSLSRKLLNKVRDRERARHSRKGKSKENK